MFAATCAVSPSPSSVSSAAAIPSPPFSPRPGAAPRGSLTNNKPWGGGSSALLVSRAGASGGARTSLLGQSSSISPPPLLATAPSEAKLKPTPAGRLSSQISSSSGTVARSGSHTVEEESLLPPTGAGQRAGGGVGRQVVVEEGVLSKLMEKIDLLEARLREFEHREVEERAKKKGGKR